MERPTPLSPSGRRASRETARSAAPQEARAGGAQRSASSQASRPAPSPSRPAGWADAGRARVRASIVDVYCRSSAKAPGDRAQAPGGH